MRALCLLLLAACAGDSDKDTTDTVDTDTSDTDTCETLPGTCGNMATGDTGCPEGYACWGPSAFVCFKGDCNLPICLPPTTRVWTPDGERALWTLRVGDPVWTLDEAGEPTVVPVLRLGSTLAPPSHEVVHLTLSDGRGVTGSPGHPTRDGRLLGDLATGEVLDGAAITSAALQPYDFPRTFDLRPAGPTGAYRADGVWLGSTLGRSGR